MEDEKAKGQKKAGLNFRLIITIIANVFIDFLGMRRAKEKKIMRRLASDEVATQIAKEKRKKQKSKVGQD